MHLLSEFKTNYKIAYPVILGQIGHILVGFADNIMVGALGAAPLAAVSLTNSLLFIIFSLGIGFTLAITPLTAEANGAKDYKTGQKIFMHGVLLSFFLAVFLCGILFLLKPFIVHLNQPKEVVSHVFPYFDILIVSMIPMILFQSYKQFADGLAQTKYAMWATIIANLVNVFLNYVLIYGKFGFPRMELTGAAIGTLISRITMLVLMVYFFRTRKVFAPFIQKIHLKFLNKKHSLKLIKLGYPTALQMLFEIGIFGAGILLSGMIGTKAQAANQICLNLATMTFMVSMGLSVTATIRIGNYKGQGNFLALKQAAYSLFVMIILLDILFAVLFISLKDWLPLAYINDISVVQMAAKLLVISGLFQIPDGIQIILLGSLRGLQDVKIPTWITFISYWVVGIPICYYLGLCTSFKTSGIWIGFFISLSIAAALLYIRFKKLTNYNQLNLLHNANSQIFTCREF